MNPLQKFAEQNGLKPLGYPNARPAGWIEKCGKCGALSTDIYSFTFEKHGAQRKLSRCMSCLEAGLRDFVPEAADELLAFIRIFGGKM